jgi:antitoxin (DNA-binding transcriptional repressor) of toxin-antitoxin stability system
MKKLSIREARQAMSQLDQLLADEGEVTITRRGQAIARVVGLGKRRPIPSHKALRDRMRRMRTGSEKLIRADRDTR